MKSVLLSVVVLGCAAAGVAGAAEGKKCGSAEKKAYIRQIDRFSAGEGTPTDVEQSRFIALKAKFACGKIKKSQFCYEARQSANFVVRGIQEEMRVGSRTEADLAAAKAEVSTLETQCQAQ